MKTESVQSAQNMYSTTGCSLQGVHREEYCFCTGLEGLAEQLQFAETGVDVNLIPKPSLARAGES